MEFKITKTAKGEFVATFTINARTVTEAVPAEALLVRDELMKYCKNRLYALKDKYAREKGKTYQDINNDLGKDFEVSDERVVEKLSRRPV